MKCSLVFAVYLCALLPSAAWGAKKPSKEELAAVTARGAMLAECDQAAWHATDAVRATHPPKGTMGHYLARKTASGWVVDFGRLNAERDKFLVAYEATQTDAPTNFAVQAFDPAREDVGFNLAAAKAIDLAVAAFGLVDRPYNTAVLPAEGGELYVYVYPAQVKVGVYPYGGDVRYRVSADGTTLIETHRMHKAVLESVPAKVPEGTSVAGGFHNDIYGDLPEDTDVFLVLSRQPKIPEYVGAGGHVFAIDVDGKIKISK